MGYLLGVDLATNGVTAVLVQPGAGVVARAFNGHPTQSPRTGWTEQQPEDWWVAAKQSIADVLASAGAQGTEIDAIGLSGQMHGLVLVDERGRPVRPAIIWTDQRGREQAEWITQRVDMKEWLAMTATRPEVGTAGTRLLWVKQHEPQIFARAYKMLAPKDYLRLGLTGEFATDVTDAASTLLFDVPARVWSQQAMNVLEISEELLPHCYESQVVSGGVSIEAAEELGLKVGTPVIAGSGNQAAAAMGLGVVRSKEVAAILGSGGVLLASMNNPLIDRDFSLQTFCHARRTKWFLVGMTQTAGISFRWMRDTFCNAEKEVARQNWDDAYYLMTRQAQQVPIGSEGLIFLPYLSGERAPYFNPQARGAFYGITARHDRAHFIRAVMEGVAFSMRDCLEVMKQTGVIVDRVVLAGGGMQSQLWRQIFADVFATDLIRTNVDDPAPYGAALMATVAAGHYPSVELACEEMVQAIDFVDPIPDNVARYEEAYQIYRSLYPALVPSYAKTACFVDVEECETV